MLERSSLHSLTTKSYYILVIHLILDLNFTYCFNFSIEKAEWFLETGKTLLEPRLPKGKTALDYSVSIS